MRTIILHTNQTQGVSGRGYDGNFDYGIADDGVGQSICMEPARCNVLHGIMACFRLEAVHQRCTLLVMSASQIKVTHVDTYLGRYCTLRLL